MDVTPQLEWHPSLVDPTGCRIGKPRTCGKTMVIDKGLGLRAFEDLLETAGPYIDLIKIGFGTTPLYPLHVLRKKIELAKQHRIAIMPGGTFLEVAVAHNAVGAFFEMVEQIGFTAVEVSDGTIDISRPLRNELIYRGLEAGLTVYTEYGKKLCGLPIHVENLIGTVAADVERGAALVTIEGRESGTGVGIFDERGNCRDDELHDIVRNLPDPKRVMWEAPQKSQQVHLLKTIGPDANLGNIAPQDILSLETLRRGLRADTFDIRRRQP